MSRLLKNQSRRISIYRLQRRPSFGFESSVSSTVLKSDDPVGVPKRAVHATRVLARIRTYPYRFAPGSVWTTL